MEDSIKTQDEVLKLRKRLLDFQRTGAMAPESFMTYQQTILQLWQEAERRRQACMAQKETLLRQAAAAESQAHAFSAMSSIMFSVIDGYVSLEEKRIREEQERAQEKQAAEEEEKEEAANKALLEAKEASEDLKAYVAEAAAKATKTKGRPKKK